jgi:hypothetical protein
MCAMAALGIVGDTSLHGVTRRGVPREACSLADNAHSVDRILDKRLVVHMNDATWTLLSRFGGQTYTEVPGTAFLLTNNGVAGKTATTDLKMFQIDGIPAGLPTLSIAATTPTAGTAVTMIGAGLDWGAFTRWSVNTSTSPWTWTEVPSGGNFAGYKTVSSRALRWGTNNVSGTGDWIFFDNRDVLTMQTTFVFADGTSEAQAVVGDSGGPVFVRNGGQWELAGIMVTVGAFSGQPSPGLTAVFGNVTYMADLSFYRDQIVAVVPEPDAATLAGVALAAAAAWGALGRRSRA